MNHLLLSLKDLDQKIVVGLVPQRKKYLDRWMVWFTMLGDGWLWLVVGLVALLLKRESTILFYRLTAGLMIEVAIYKVIKNVCSRPRPYQRLENVSCLLQPPDVFSFPSGHTAAAFVVAVTIGSFYSALLAPFLILACLIGFSRVYLGAHYPSDVLGGAVLGICCSELVRWWIV